MSRATCTSTLRLKVRHDAYAWLGHAALEVNTVWNWANETSEKAVRRYVGAPEWLSGFDLCGLSAGASRYFTHISAATIQRVVCQYAANRWAAKRARLAWRKSRGYRESLGWVPFRGSAMKLGPKAIRLHGKSIRVFEFEKLEGVKWKSGQFAQDKCGDWWLCLPVEAERTNEPAPKESVGIDLGLKDVAVTSDGDRLEAARFYRDSEQKIAQAQRRGHKRQAKRLHRKAARQRKDALHKFTTGVVSQYQKIAVGDVSSTKLAKTKMAKAVLDSGWGMLKQMLLYKGERAGRSVEVVNEAYTSRTCSSCGALTGPQGVNGLRVRRWTCGDCGESHDRDINAAKNILRRAEVSASVCGNDPGKMPENELRELVVE